MEFSVKTLSSSKTKQMTKWWDAECGCPSGCSAGSSMGCARFSPSLAGHPAWGPKGTQGLCGLVQLGGKAYV